MKAARFEFHTTLTTDGRLPRWKGSTFRGGFGWALRRAVCVTRGRECRDCLLASRCLYARTFEADLRKGPDGRAPSPPLPYVIEPPEDPRQEYRAGDPLRFSLILLGDTVDMLPYFVYAFQLMGEEGLGRRADGSRARYRIDQVTQRDRILYDGETRTLSPVDPLELRIGTLPDGGNGRLTVTLQTPLRLKRNNELAADLPFEDLVRGVLRRIATTFQEFGEGEPPLDYRGLVFRAKNVRTVRSGCRWEDPPRYSNRQKERMLMGGLVGDLLYEGEIAPYLPLLELASFLHIGKQTTFGHGRFTCTFEAAP